MDKYSRQSKSDYDLRRPQSAGKPLFSSSRVNLELPINKMQNLNNFSTLDSVSNFDKLYPVSKK